ncbi:MAG: hypothetical protein AB8H79_25010 [Myxococcota bacterium]
MKSESIDSTPISSHDAPPSQPAALASSPPGQEDAERCRVSPTEWQNLRQRARALGCYLAPGGPQVLDGEGIVWGPPTLNDSMIGQIGKVVVWRDPSANAGSPGLWNELWEVDNRPQFDTLCQVTRTQDLPPDFEPSDVLQAPLLPGTARAHMKFDYQAPPSAAQIAALPNAPAGASTLRFNVYNGPNGQGASQQTGRLFRILGPNDQVMDFWALWHTYQYTTINGWDLWVALDQDPVTSQQPLQLFLETMPSDAKFVFAAYEWQSS